MSTIYRLRSNMFIFAQLCNNVKTIGTYFVLSFICTLHLQPSNLLPACNSVPKSTFHSHTPTLRQTSRGRGGVMSAET